MVTPDKARKTSAENVQEELEKTKEGQDEKTKDIPEESEPLTEEDNIRDDIDDESNQNSDSEGGFDKTQKVGMDLDVLREELDRFREELMDDFVLKMIEDKLEENLPVIKEMVQTELIDTIPDIDYVVKIKDIMAEMVSL